MGTKRKSEELEEVLEKEELDNVDKPFEEIYLKSDFEEFTYSERPSLKAENLGKKGKYAPIIMLSYDLSNTKYRLKLKAVDRIKILYKEWREEAKDKSLLARSNLTGSIGRRKGFFNGVTLGMLKESLDSLKQIVLNEENWMEVSKGKRDDF